MFHEILTFHSLGYGHSFAWPKSFHDHQVGVSCLPDRERPVYLLHLDPK